MGQLGSREAQAPRADGLIVQHIKHHSKVGIGAPEQHNFTEGWVVKNGAVKHRDYFLVEGTSDESVHAPPPPTKIALASGGMLLVCLVAVVGLAKLLSPTVEAAVASAGAPPAVVGIVIAALVLLPEGLAALRAARADRLQTSMNLALGSALASIGLTIPTVAAVFIAVGKPLTLGLGPTETVLLALTLLVSTLTLHSGRTTMLQGVVHLVILAAYLFLSVVP